ncbi:MAG: NACHT domain-containing protein [Sulfuricellaceae bacterium]
MPKPVAIRILEHDNNRRGDLFGRLMGDLFVALGYEQPRLNIQKSGREIDLDAKHRLETRRAIGECKATQEAIGGADLNKLVGVLDAEHDDKLPLTGYFVSLSGFKETAIEQEHKRTRKIVLLDGGKVVEELINGRILISRDHAAEQAGRCCAAHACLTLNTESELLAHEKGWIWALYYAQGMQRSHFVLIHSDGTPLARQIAEEIINADKTCGGNLHSLDCLNPAPSKVSTAKEALESYRKYLDNECGHIQLDGLPADSDVGSRRLRLENLFVPLYLDVITGEQKVERQPAGKVLADHSRLAILAAPGGGKSTLIKRLAVAYADLARLGQADDELPQRAWLPLFFRCRELRELARGSFAELLDALSQREPVRLHAAEFRAHADSELLAGRVLLLVDGLDEISDDGDRAAFVCTLRSALMAYPGIALVVTSREAGFRHVAPHLAPICTRATLSPFNDDDIRRLSVAWHKEVVNDSEKVRIDAETLADSIARNDRICRLASNPLLLTTLLLVKRWVGSLPTRRAVLYGKAVEVLLMTWNTEGHEPIPQEEALPQLCYVASAMMLAGIQKISRPRLAACLQEARDALPTELGYVKEPVDQFIRRVEDRSSLLMMSGHDIEDGRLVEFFEFRHLTFQEYLAAQAMVKGWHPGRKDDDTLAGVLEPHFKEEAWREVIPLAAVQGGRETEGLIRRLTEQVRTLATITERQSEETGIPTLLATCLADEASARPDTIKAAVRELVRFGNEVRYISSFPELVKGKYGENLLEEVRREFFSPAYASLVNAASILSTFTWKVAAEGKNIARLVDMLLSPDRATRLEGALGCMQAYYSYKQNSNPTFQTSQTSQIGDALVNILYSDQMQEQYCATWALAWLGESRLWIPPEEPDVLGRLFMIWRHGKGDENINRFAGWALRSQRLMSRDDTRYLSSVPKEDIADALKSFEQLSEDMQIIALVVAWYSRAFSDEKLEQNCRALLKNGTSVYASKKSILHNLLKKIGKDPSP